MIKFETGTEYSTRSICDSECVFTVNIIRRTARSVWIKDMNGETVRRSIHVLDGVEFFFPYGKYSMAPVIKATGKVFDRFAAFWRNAFENMAEREESRNGNDYC